MIAFILHYFYFRCFHILLMELYLVPTVREAVAALKWGIQPSHFVVHLFSCVIYSWASILLLLVLLLLLLLVLAVYLSGNALYSCQGHFIFFNVQKNLFWTIEFSCLRTSAISTKLLRCHLIVLEKWEKKIRDPSHIQNFNCYATLMTL